MNAPATLPARVEPAPTPPARTEAAVLAEFVARVLKGRPRLSHLIETRLLIGAVNAARIGRN